MPNQNSYAAVHVKCPFFHKENATGKMIGCEGIVKSSLTELHFRSPAAQKRYMAYFCDCHYKECLIFQALDKKYETQT